MIIQKNFLMWCLREHIICLGVLEYWYNCTKNLILGYSSTERGDKKSEVFMIEEIIIQRYVGNNQQGIQSSLY